MGLWRGAAPFSADVDKLRKRLQKIRKTTIDSKSGQGL
jgi:hypothetical protein